MFNLKHAAMALLATASLLIGGPVISQDTGATEDGLLALKSLAQNMVPEGSDILAVCGSSDGKGYYLWPRHDGWQSDPISGGRLVFFVTPENEPNILFLDALGEFINAREDGGILSFSFLDPKTGSFGIIETYPSTGVTSTYVVTVSPEGELFGLWTSLKSHVSQANISKVTAHVTRCAA
ncbi:MAG: hypothetical protein GW858_10155 [Sphingomonadales bacterium]|nr:hypothetical protein [Sphingomonadales bacterium]NCQ21408.1 hypothetical protein [Sphingomonadales bacterium]NCT04195.1 hypothetical protein [Sphingomonadales bacterium]